MTTPHEDIVSQLWKIFDEREFERVRELLHDDFVCIWPQSKEKIVGADNFIALNANYPGEWSIDVVRLISSGDTVVSEIELTHKHEKVHAVSFFEFADDKIIKATEYWGDVYEAPDWRRQWTQPL